MDRNRMEMMQMQFLMFGISPTIKIKWDSGQKISLNFISFKIKKIYWGQWDGSVGKGRPDKSKDMSVIPGIHMVEER